MSKKHRVDIDTYELQKLISEKEPEANIIISKIMGIIAILYLLTFLLFRLKFFRGNTLLADIVLLGGAVLLLTSVVVSLAQRGRGRWIKYLLIFVMLLSVFGLNLLTGYKTWLVFTLPLIISCRYYSISLIAVTNVLSSVLIVASAFCNAYVSPLFGYLDLNMVSFPDETTLNIYHWLYWPVIHAGLDKEVILSNTLRLSAFPNLLIILVVTFACLAVIQHSQKMMLKVSAVAQQKSDVERELSNNRAKIMLSQIQPHFLYNTLSAIMAIDGNPEETVDAIGEFGKYLRENLDVLTSGDMVSFSKEMQHVARYISLEQLRFKDKIQITYDLKANAFSLPALTV